MLLLCMAELLEFSKILKCKRESKGLFKSWNIYGYNKVYMGIISLAYQLIIFYKLVAKGVCYSNKHNHLWKGLWKQNAIKNCVYNFEIGDVGRFFYAWDWSWQHALDNNLTTEIAKFYHWIRDERFCILSMIINFLTTFNQELVWTPCIMHRCVISTLFGSCFSFF
jgi:hypothetical protein